jgi:DNA-binding PadR family transcriptional regulator
LGAHLRKLEDAQYIAVTKAFVARKPQTYINATPKGRQAFAEHLAALEPILNTATVSTVKTEHAADGTLTLEQHPR